MECDSVPTTIASSDDPVPDTPPAPLCSAPPEFCGDSNCQCDGVNRPTIDGVMVSSIDSALCEFCGQHASKCECDTVPLAMPVVVRHCISLVAPMTHTTLQDECEQLFDPASPVHPSTLPQWHLNPV